MELTGAMGFAAFLGAVLGLLAAYWWYSRRFSIEVVDVL